MLRERYSIKDFITIGILTALNFVIFMIVASATAVLGPVVHIFSVCITGLFSASVFLLMVKKVNKPWILTISTLILMGIFSVVGGSYLPWFISVMVTVIIGDIILIPSKYQSEIMFHVAIGVMMIGHSLGNVLPVIFFAEKFRREFVSRGVDPYFIDYMISFINIKMAFVVMGTAFICGVIGSLLGHKWLRKHFKVAGVL